MIDVFYKIKSLFELGYQITLHCYEYNDREITKELNKYCFRIKTYTRSTVLINPFKIHYPMIVFTRNSRMLLHELSYDNAPILFEGLHTTYFIKHPKLKHRIKLVRTHNIEHHYYQALASNEKNLFKKLYFYLEAKALSRYEKALRYAQGILAISANDLTYLQNKYEHVNLINAFHGFEWKLNAESKTYALYHGKLSVNENENAAQYLIKKVFSKTDTELIIAGYKPSHQLKKLVAQYPHITLIENPDEKQMQQLIMQAHMHILPTFQSTGIKLKLLHVLLNGKHIICNREMVEGTGLAEFVHLADSAESMLQAIDKLKHIAFNEEDYTKRKNALQAPFSNKLNAQKIDSIIQQLVSQKV